MWLGTAAIWVPVERWHVEIQLPNRTMTCCNAAVQENSFEVRINRICKSYWKNVLNYKIWRHHVLHYKVWRHNVLHYKIWRHNVLHYKVWRHNVLHYKIWCHDVFTTKFDVITYCATKFDVITSVLVISFWNAKSSLPININVFCFFVKLRAVL